MILPRFPGIRAVSKAKSVSEPDPENRLTLMGVAPFARDRGTLKGERHVSGARS